jgi:acetyl/propionyl-CoA carboxylase alpha subunit
LRIVIANRAEIAVRIQSTIQQLGHTPLGLYTAAEGVHAPHLLHLPLCDRLLIPGQGARAYLDGPSLIAVAQAAKADAVIPGYGFLSESPEFARAVSGAGLIWIGPRAETLALFGDKYASKQFARECGVPVLDSTSAEASEAEIRTFAETLPRGTKVLLKALEGGGGRGIRIVNDLCELSEAYAGCKREAMSSFGSDKVFAEPFLEGARHIEVQVLGDGKGNVRDLGERECT